ncbi:MAG TPA: hypothetical protein PK869_01005 [Candidatus Hydrogenedentes bacterium]|nr:hypothetical protein [Candidatus Hydrogenedentota bacterium]
MPRATSLFSAEQKAAIEKAVASAEQKTAVEIVPVVATASGRYDRAEDIIGLIGGMKAMAIAYTQLPDSSAARTGAWDGTAVAYQIPVLLLAVFVGFMLAAFVASRLHWLRRLFTPAIQMREETGQAARRIFYDSRIHHTKDASGLLIYVSLYERTAVLLADAAITEKLGQGTLDELTAGLVSGIRAGDITAALATTINAAGNKLEAVLPRSSHDTNELSDTLILID